MAYVIRDIVAGTSGNVDLTINVGSTSDRKAIAFVGAQDAAEDITAFAVERDPTGTPDAMTAVGAIQSVYAPSAEVTIKCQMFRLDLSVTGSQTFRGTVATGTDNGLVLGVLVWDELASGAPEAGPEFVTATTQMSISDAITTVANDAVLFPVVFQRGYGDGNDWISDNGETVHEEFSNDGARTMVLGSLVDAVAGAQTVGYTYTPAGTPTNFDGAIMVTASLTRNRS